MAESDKTTIKIRAYDGKAAADDAQSNLSEEQNNAFELAKKTAQLQEEKKKSVEHLKMIESLQDIIKQEQARSAELAKTVASLEAKLKELSGPGSNVQKIAELEATVKELSGVIGEISMIAAAGKTR